MDQFENVKTVKKEWTYINDWWSESSPHGWSYSYRKRREKESLHQMRRLTVVNFPCTDWFTYLRTQSKTNYKFIRISLFAWSSSNSEGICSINDLPVTGYPCYTQRTLGSPRGIHCKSLEGIVWRIVVSTSKKRFWGEINASSSSFSVYQNFQ